MWMTVVWPGKFVGSLAVGLVFISSAGTGSLEPFSMERYLPGEGLGPSSSDDRFY